MPSPFFIVQGYDERNDTPFFHETAFHDDDLWNVACNIAAGQFQEFRIDRVLCFDPTTLRMKDVTHEALNLVVSKCASEHYRLPETVSLACTVYCVRVPEGLLPDYRIDARETHDSTLSQREAA